MAKRNKPMTALGSIAPTLSGSLMGRINQRTQGPMYHHTASVVAGPQMRTVVVHLTKGAFALIDAVDVPIVQPYRWHLTSAGYAARTEKGIGCVLMHRAILGASCGPQVDHRNGDRLDNRRSNIRPCTASENSANRAPFEGRKYKGVVGPDKHGGFRAEIADEYIGYFKTEIEAAVAYDVRAVERYGDFARLNFPQDN